MNDLLNLSTSDLTTFLKEHLPSLSEDWWCKNVEARLTFQQQRMVNERGITSLEQLDFAALLRIIDQNWYELSQLLTLPREGRTWVKELQTVRNKWAHLSSQTIEPSEVYRDADTLSRFLNILQASPESIVSVNAKKTDALSGMAANHGFPTNQDFSDPNANKMVVDNNPQENKEAPSELTSTKFQAGDIVALRSDPEIVMPVIEVVSGGAECRYRVFQNNKIATYYESQLQHSKQVNESVSLVNIDGLHAYLTSLQLLSPSIANLHSLRSGRIKFVPYQYRPVLKLIRADRPRLLIADEVGVGKTIEAGLIIKELRARMDINSVLIICPKALVAERKWYVEMKRFDENFTALDGSLLRHCLQETHLDGEWPDQYAKSIVPFSLFDSDLMFGKKGKGRRSTEGLLALDPPPKFDLVIVDEAHHIRNSETFLHQAVRYFCDNAQAAIFLTATPVQLGSEDLFTLLNVLRPDLVIDHASFEQMAAPNRPINTAVQHCRAAEENWQSQARTCLDEAAQTQWGQLFLRESPAFQAIYDQLREQQLGDSSRISLIHALEELYTFSPMINRTRRRDIGEFTTRKPETLRIKFTAEQQQLHDNLLDLVARILTHTHGQQNVKFMMTTIRRQAASCLYGLVPLLNDILTNKIDNLEMMEVVDANVEADFSFIDEVRVDIEALLSEAKNLDSKDPKAEAFLQVLQDKLQMENNKVLLFTTFRHTLAYLESHTKDAEIRYGLVHGSIPDYERAEIRHRFSLPKEDPNAVDVLLSSEVGCEGLDFQFCDLLINYDLPWNPMRVEQRIGRIDRYGQQSETVAIVNLITPGTVDADIYERCLWRIGVFQHAVGGSEEILGEVTREIHDIAESFSLSKGERELRLQQLGDNGIRQIQEEQKLEEKQAELFGLNVPTQSWRKEVKAAETFWLSAEALERCVSTYLGVLTESAGKFLLGEKYLKRLRLNREARAKLLEDFRQQPKSTDPVARQWEKWLKGDDPMLSVTFDQETAVNELKVIHLNVLHPLIRQAARSQERSEAIHVSLSISSTEIASGEYPFALYHWRKVGIRSDDTLVAITAEPTLDQIIMTSLVEALDSQQPAHVTGDLIEALDREHHNRWAATRVEHITGNCEMVEHRRQSLNISHQARCNLLEDQLSVATNEKIRRMKESELARAKQDYERRMMELEKASNSADIHATPVVFGIFCVEGRRKIE